MVKENNQTKDVVATVAVPVGGFLNLLLPVHTGVYS